MFVHVRILLIRQNQILLMESTTDAAEWKLVIVERVLPLLTVHIRTDNKVQKAIAYKNAVQMSSLQPFCGGDLTSFDTKFHVGEKTSAQG